MVVDEKCRKIDGSTTVGSDIVVNRPFVVTVISFAFVVRLVWIIFGERVRNAFVEDFRSIVWPIGPFVRDSA